MTKRITTVRLAEPEDAGPITRVHIRSWQWGYQGLMPAGYLASLDDKAAVRAQQRRRHLEADQTDNPTFVATEAGVVIGFANIGHYRVDQREGNLDKSVGEVYAIYVDPDRIGTGTGLALMDASIQWMRERDLDPVRLWVLEGNARARAFYERRGFRLDGGRGVYVLKQPGELPIELAEVRLARTAG